MTGTPPLPDDVAEQVRLALGWPAVATETTRAVLSEAWPVLFAHALRWAGDEITESYPEDVFGTTSIERSRAATAVLRPIGQSVDTYSAAGARVAARLLHRWSDPHA